MILFALGLAFCWFAASVFTLLIFRYLIQRNEHADH
jgi:hypothetical protein